MPCNLTLHNTMIEVRHAASWQGGNELK